MVSQTTDQTVPKQCFGPCFDTLLSVLWFFFGTLRSTTEAWSALGSMLRPVLRFRVRVKVKVRIRVRVS